MRIPKPAPPWRARLKPALAGAAGCAALGLGLFLVTDSSDLNPDGLASWVTDSSYDWLYLVRPAKSVEGAVLVLMDEASFVSLNQPLDKPSEWDRKLHARLIDRLKACGARAIVFDISFSTNTTNDGPFLRAIQEASKAHMPVIVAGTVLDTARDRKMPIRELLRPFADLQTVAAWGLAEQQVEGRIVRRHFGGDLGEPSLAWRAAQLTQAKPLPPAKAERWYNYYGRPRQSIPSSTYAATFHEPISASKFSNQVVFVGSSVTRGASRDIWETPRGQTPGVELNATAYLNLVRDDWLRRLGPGSELVLFLAVGLALGGGLALCRPPLATALAVVAGLGIGAAATWVAWHKLVWFSWLVLALAQPFAAWLWSVLVHFRRMVVERKVLEEKLAAIEPALELIHEGADSKSTVRANAGTAVRSAPDSAPAPGEGAARVIADHTLLRRVGEGAFGEVWLARNAVGIFHAVKLVYRSSFRSDEPFEREFRGIQRCMPVSRLHPGLVQILHVGRNEAAGCIYYVMEPGDDVVTGQQIQPESYSPKNLASEIQRRGKLPGVECLQLALDLTSALDFLHGQHLIHRDIKPSNILFVRGVPKLADIGLVTDVAATGAESTYIGTKGYIAPEGPGRPPADIYSLGRVLYEAWTGLPNDQFPQIPATLKERSDRELLMDLNDIILKAARRELAERYHLAAQMQTDLLQLQASLQKPKSSG